MTPDETLTVRCPQCSGESLWNKDNPYRPFCCKRCKLIDLGAWASESYRVPVAGKLDGENEEFIATDDEKNGQTPF